MKLMPHELFVAFFSADMVVLLVVTLASGLLLLWLDWSDRRTVFTKQVCYCGLLAIFLLSGTFFFGLVFAFWEAYLALSLNGTVGRADVYLSLFPGFVMSLFALALTMRKESNHV